jgi:hypothetical protein
VPGGGIIPGTKIWGVVCVGMYATLRAMRSSMLGGGGVAMADRGIEGGAVFGVYEGRRREERDALI